MQLVAAILLLLARAGPRPVGAAASCYEGAYRTADAALWGACTGWARCEPGHYCSGMPLGERRPCPAGRYGASAGLASAGCDGACAPGHVCPAASVSATAAPCGGADVYCAGGDAAPTPVSPGHYSTPADGGAATRTGEAPCAAGRYCAGGVARACPGGAYGAAPRLTSAACSGACEEGFYCPSGSTSPRALACGPEPTRFCPAGSSQRRDVRPGHVAVRRGGAVAAGYTAERPGAIGEYVIDGVARPCPAGRYGDAALNRNASCAASP